MGCGNHKGFWLEGKYFYLSMFYYCFFIRHQVRAKSGAGSCPLQMVAYWKCEDSHTDLRLDYKYNAHTMATPCPLLNLSVAVPIDGGVKNMQSQPNGSW